MTTAAQGFVIWSVPADLDALITSVTERFGVDRNTFLHEMVAPTAAALLSQPPPGHPMLPGFEVAA